MTVRRKGYAVLLALTIVLTVAGVLWAVLPSGILPPAATGTHARLAVVLGHLLVAGAVCIVRKRFYTEIR